MSEKFEEYWEENGATIIKEHWREKWGEYIVDDGPPVCDVPVEELARLCVSDTTKSFVTPDESLDDGVDSASDVPRGEPIPSNQQPNLLHL